LPWGHTNLIGSVYLNPVAAPAAGAAAASGPTAATAGSEVELGFWRSIRDSNKPEELNAYLTNYPNGQFKSLALARIASLRDGPSTATRNLSTGVDKAVYTDEATQVSEDQVGLDKGQRRDVQRRLSGLGFDTKVTGKFDESTRSVIMRWQAARGYPKTGFLNKPQHTALLSEIVAKNDEPEQRSAPERRGRHHGGGGGGGGGGLAGPGQFIGGMVGGMFGRR
jgi:peptidoglycan hydrolase-like protein with peptidoglycan-binding domain